MTPEERRITNSLCTRIQEEKDGSTFESLVAELNEVIIRKQRRISPQFSKSPSQRSKAWKSLTGVVRKLLPHTHPNEPERVEITISDADDLFREIRIPNLFTGLDGGSVGLKNGAAVDITLEADAQDAVKREVRRSD